MAGARRLHPPGRPGIYSWLPLGYRVLRNVEEIVREEMDAIGAQEVHFPALLPREPYEATGRWTDYGDSVFRLKDRKGADYLLGPTHEEMFALLVKDLYSSYKDLPLCAVPDPDEVPRRGAAAGRDAARPRVRDEGLVLLRHRRRRARGVLPGAPRGLHQIFDRLGFDYVIVHAMSGAMGGSASEEFLAVAENGEDTFVRSPRRLRRQRRGRPDPAAAGPCRTTTPRRRTSRTLPDTPTIDTLVDMRNAELPAAGPALARPPTR